MSSKFSQRRRALVMGLGGAWVLAGCGESRFVPVGNGAVLRFGGESMGSTWSVKIAGFEGPPALRRTLADRVEEALAAVDRRMSLYRADSELAAFNAHGADAPFPMSAALFDVFDAAREASGWSDGAFDVTVAPLVQAWGFGPEPRREVPPTDWLTTQRSVVGFRGLHLDRMRRTVVKARAGMAADLGGIAKGYAVDAAARVLEELKIAHYMVEAGGELRTRGLNAAGEPWRIGIEQPDASPQRARLVVPLSGRAMATSGDYRNYFWHAGRRYSHELDPRTGAPVDQMLCSASVVADDCMRADALATGLMVLGLEEGLARAEASGLAAHFVTREPGGAYRDHMTRAFAALRPRAV